MICISFFSTCGESKSFDPLAMILGIVQRFIFDLYVDPAYLDQDGGQRSSFGQNLKN